MAQIVIDVAPGEHGVLTVAQALFGHRTPALPHVLRRAQKIPDPLSPEALGVLEQILATGWVLSLTRRGGWHGGPNERLWNRHSAPPLSFSRFAIRLCQWMAGTPLWSEDAEALELRPQTMGDQLLCYLALDLAPVSSVRATLARQAPIRAATLAWLGFADVLGAAGEPDTLDASCVTSDVGRVIHDALAPELTRRWVAMERDKAHIVEIDRMVALGAAQRAVLVSTLSAFDAAGCRERARFLIAAAARLGSEPWDPAAALDRGVPMADRALARGHAAAFVRGFDTVAGWVREARATRFFDDDYEQAQRLLGLWETLGDAGYRRLVAVADELEAFAEPSP